jgi:hypothetical protein
MAIITILIFLLDDDSGTILIDSDAPGMLGWRGRACRGVLIPYGDASVTNTVGSSSSSSGSSSLGLLLGLCFCGGFGLCLEGMLPSQFGSRTEAVCVRTNNPVELCMDVRDLCLESSRFCRLFVLFILLVGGILVFVLEDGGDTGEGIASDDELAHGAEFPDHDAGTTDGGGERDVVSAGIEPGVEEGSGAALLFGLDGDGGFAVAAGATWSFWAIDGGRSFALGMEGGSFDGLVVFWDFVFLEGAEGKGATNAAFEAATASTSGGFGGGLEHGGEIAVIAGHSLLGSGESALREGRGPGEARGGWGGRGWGGRGGRGGNSGRKRRRQAGRGGGMGRTWGRSGRG